MKVIGMMRAIGVVRTLKMSVTRTCFILSRELNTSDWQNWTQLSFCEICLHE